MYYWCDTATDEAVAALLVDIASGVNLPAPVRDKLLSCALTLGATDIERAGTSWPIMVVDDADGGVIAYATTEAVAFRIVNALELETE